MPHDSLRLRGRSLRAKAHEVPSVPVVDKARVQSVPLTPGVMAGRGADYDQRPPAWQVGLGEEALTGAYRQVFTLVAAATEPVTAQELTRALGRDATRMNEVEKVRHRAYALEARGWLVRGRGGVSTAAGPAGGAAA